MTNIILTRFGKSKPGFSFTYWPTSKLPEIMEVPVWLV